jgi:hypothetical protein
MDEPKSQAYLEASVPCLWFSPNSKKVPTPKDVGTIVYFSKNLVAWKKLCCKANFLIIMIEFKSMASTHNGCSYHQAKTPIDFWCRRDLNPGPLLDDKRLYQLS